MGGTFNSPRENEPDFGKEGDGSWQVRQVPLGKGEETRVSGPGETLGTEYAGIAPSCQEDLEAWGRFQQVNVK